MTFWIIAFLKIMNIDKPMFGNIGKKYVFWRPQICTIYKNVNCSKAPEEQCNTVYHIKLGCNLS